MIRVGICGGGGRMGKEIIAALREDENAALTAVFESPDSPAAAEIDAAVARDMESAEMDALIDFSVPAATMRALAVCRRRKIALVIGTTGFDAAQTAAIRESATDIAVVQSPNMSVGVNVLFDLAGQAAAALRAGALGGGYDIEILEAHHRGKKDAPSGTALKLGEILAAAAGGGALADTGVFVRHGKNEQRRGGDIGFSVIRGGGIAGEHRVIFAAEGEQIELTHRAGGRRCFADGALRAAHFAAAATAGWYDMRRVLAA